MRSLHIAGYNALALAHISARGEVGAEQTQSLTKFVTEHDVDLGVRYHGRPLPCLYCHAAGGCVADVTEASREETPEDSEKAAPCITFLLLRR